MTKSKFADEVAMEAEAILIREAGEWDAEYPWTVREGEGVYGPVVIIEKQNFGIKIMVGVREQKADASLLQATIRVQAICGVPVSIIRFNDTPEARMKVKDVVMVVAGLAMEAYEAAAENLL